MGSKSEMRDFKKGILKDIFGNGKLIEIFHNDSFKRYTFEEKYYLDGQVLQIYLKGVPPYDAIFDLNVGHVLSSVTLEVEQVEKRVFFLKRKINILIVCVRFEKRFFRRRIENLKATIEAMKKSIEKKSGMKVIFEFQETDTL